MSYPYKMAARYTEKYRDRLHSCPYCHNTRVEITPGRDHEIVTGPDGKRTWGKTRYVWSGCCGTYACDCTAEYPHVEDAVKEWEEKHTTEKIRRW